MAAAKSAAVAQQRYERGSTIVTSNLPFEDWTSVLGSERLTGALLDRLTHHVSILTMNGDSYRLKESAGRRRDAATQAGAVQNQATAVDPDTGEITQDGSRRQSRLQKGPRSGALFFQTTKPRQTWPTFTSPHWPAIRPTLTVSLDRTRQRAPIGSRGNLSHNKSSKS